MTLRGSDREHRPGVTGTARRSLVAILLAAALPAGSVAQVHSIAASGEYVFALKKRLGVETATAFGGGAELRLRLSDRLTLGAGASYVSYSIEQPGEVDKWDWAFWTNRYYPKIQSDLRADPNLSVQLGSVQTMEVIPVELSLLYGLPAGEDLTVTPKLTGGIAFYTRKLYAEETWTKRFPQADYELTYGLRNFAPDKTGNVWFGGIGCEISYRLFSDLSLLGEAQYRAYVSASSGFSAFPLAGEGLVRLGVAFLY